ncbi:MAG: hypothetical protein RID91_18375, partial [Azospirillaceae bacterium]
AARPGVPARLADGTELPGLAPAAWRLILDRTRGGRPGAWTVTRTGGTTDLALLDMEAGGGTGPREPSTADSIGAGTAGDMVLPLPVRSRAA